jgi:hypothetical protein
MRAQNSILYFRSYHFATVEKGDEISLSLETKLSTFTDFYPYFTYFVWYKLSAPCCISTSYFLLCAGSLDAAH